MPGADIGRTPSARSSAWIPAEEITRGWPAPASSPVMISLKARPTQPRESSPLRFSRRRTARRSTAVPADWRMQLAEDIAGRTAARAAVRTGRKVCPTLENTRLQGQQFLEFRQIAQPREGRIVGQFLAILIALLKRLAQVS